MEMDPELKERVTAKPTWTRGLYILLFVIIYSIAEIVVYGVVVLQFLFTLFTGTCNTRLQELGRNLSTFIYQVFTYLTYNSDEKPFPFAPWPGESEALAAPAKKKKKAAKKKTAARKPDDKGQENPADTPET